MTAMGKGQGPAGEGEHPSAPPRGPESLCRLCLRLWSWELFPEHPCDEAPQCSHCSNRMHAVMGPHRMCPVCDAPDCGPDMPKRSRRGKR